MSEKNALVLKILSLYLITSALFLGYFFNNHYEMKKQSLLDPKIQDDDVYESEHGRA